MMSAPAAGDAVASVPVGAAPDRVSPASGRRETATPGAESIVSSLPLACLVLDPALNIAAANPAAEHLIGQGARRLLGRGLGEVLGFDEPLILHRLVQGEAQLSARGVAVRVSEQAERRLDVTSAPLGGAPGWQLLVLRASERGRALDPGEGAGATTGATGAADILAHEIKNPLAAIRGAAQLLDRTLGEHDRALTTLITGEVDRIARLIDQMQPLSRRGTGPVKPCNLHEALRRAQAVIAAGAADGPAIAEEFDPSLPPVLADPDALVQVFVNLLANARDAVAGRADPRIALRTRFAGGLALHRGEGRPPLRLPIEVRISDNGPGLDPGLADHAFEPFVSSKRHGQGLGLPLVRKLVREMDGRVSHDREEPAGWTHFRVHLPVAGNAGERV